MALPQDFWQNEHMFHRFRSKPCQRLLRSGLCEWHSQCQFSHDPEWPRRPPSKHNYSPVLCPHIRPVMNNNGDVQLEKSCPSGLSCRFSHTKDEVLYHPDIFKSSLCEEHRSLTSDQRSARRSKHRPRCHRYYCPFAHGKQELRTSPLTAEQQEAVVRAIGIFPHAGCCGICTNNHLGPSCLDSTSGMGGYTSSMPLVEEASISQSQLWAGGVQSELNSMLSRMVLPRQSVDTTTSGMTEGRVWGESPWLQQPLQEQPLQQQAMLKLPSLQEAPHPQMLHTQSEQLQQEADADERDLDVESEIYGRAVRFLDELSTEESDGSEPDPITMNKDERTQHVKESCFRALPADCNRQEEWVIDVSGQGRWQQDLSLNYWNMPSIRPSAKPDQSLM